MEMGDIMEQLNFTVPCLFGLEGLVGDELRRMGLLDVRVEDRRAHFTGSFFDMARANLLMQSAASSDMKVLGLVEVNAREAMERRIAGQSAGDDFQKLCALVEKAASAKKRNVAEREERIRARGAEIARAAREEAARVLERETGRLPDIRHEELLHTHVQRLESVMQSCSSQVWSVASAASVDMDAWRKEQERALDSWQETIVLRIMDAANRHADSLGYTGMFRQKNWKSFCVN